MTSTPSKNDLRLVWAALASRLTDSDAEAAVSHERLIALIEGRVNESERESLYAALARDPDLCAAWRRLQQLVDEAPAAAPPKPSWWARLRAVFSTGSLLPTLPGPRFAMAGTAVVALGLGWGMYSNWQQTSPLDGLPSEAVAWVEQSDALRRVGLPEWSPPTLASVGARLGRRSPLQPEATPEELAFEEGFRKGRLLTQAVFAMQVPEAPNDTDPACTSESCERARQLGLNYGAWATLTALRCAAGLGASETLDASSIEAERRSEQAVYWVPSGFPWIKDETGREPCEIAEPMHLRFPEPRAEAGASRPPERAESGR